TPAKSKPNAARNHETDRVAPPLPDSPPTLSIPLSSFMASLPSQQEFHNLPGKGVRKESERSSKDGTGSEAPDRVHGCRELGFRRLVVERAGAAGDPVEPDLGPDREASPRLPGHPDPGLLEARRQPHPPPART